MDREVVPSEGQVIMFGQWHVTEAMISYGGGFVQGLGRLFRQADQDNKERLLRAFPEYFAEYAVLARKNEEELERLKQRSK
jgi:hypothetical protein